MGLEKNVEAICRGVLIRWQMSLLHRNQTRTQKVWSHKFSAFIFRHFCTFWRFWATKWTINFNLMHLNEPLQFPKVMISKFDLNFILVEKARSSNVVVSCYPGIKTSKFQPSKEEGKYCAVMQFWFSLRLFVFNNFWDLNSEWDRVVSSLGITVPQPCHVENPWQQLGEKALGLLTDASQWKIFCAQGCTTVRSKDSLQPMGNILDHYAFFPSFVLTTTKI